MNDTTYKRGDRVTILDTSHNGDQQLYPGVIGKTAKVVRAERQDSYRLSHYTLRVYDWDYWMADDFRVSEFDWEADGSDGRPQLSLWRESR